MCDTQVQRVCTCVVDALISIFLDPWVDVGCVQCPCARTESCLDLHLSCRTHSNVQSGTTPARGGDCAAPATTVGT